MRGTKRSWALVGGIVLVLSACSNGGGTNNQSSGGGGFGTTLRTAFSEDVGSIDPDNNFEVQGLGMILGMYQGLVQYEPGSAKLTGLLASSWKVSSDSKTYTFTLRQGVKFHDGTPMTSQSVKDAFERRVQHQDLFTGYFLGGVSSIDTPDPHTLVINLKSPDYSFLDGLASPWGPKVIGPDAIKTHAGSDYSKAWLAAHEDGTGPYQLTSYERGIEYSLKSFTSYWGPAAHFSEIDIKIVPDVGQQILQLQNGQIDFVDQYPFTQLSQVPSTLKTLSWNNDGMELAILNTHRLSDLSLRRAIAAAIDPSGWVPQAFGKFGSPAESNYSKTQLPPPTPWTWPTAGSSDSKSAPAITIGYATNDVELQGLVANYLIADLQRIGLHATARAIPTDQFNSLPKHASTGPDIALVHFYPDDMFPGSLSYLVYQCGTPLNYLDYCNNKADDLFNKAWGTADEAQRNTLFLDAAKVGFDDASFLGLADIQDVIVYRPGLSNLETYPALPWNFNYGLATAS
ncbi:MAG: ABC transporter substrate-binding protein [Actinomycetota bacterium]